MTIDGVLIALSSAVPLIIVAGWIKDGALREKGRRAEDFKMIVGIIALFGWWPLAIATCGGVVVIGQLIILPTILSWVFIAVLAIVVGILRLIGVGRKPKS